MATASPDPVPTASRIANGKYVSIAAVQELRDMLKKHPEVLEDMSEEDKRVVQEAMEILARKLGTSSVPPPPPDPAPANPL